MPNEDERLKRTLSDAYNDVGSKASHFAVEKNRLETVFATLSVPAIISLGSLWADSNSFTFRLVAFFATGFFFVYAVLICWDLAQADKLRKLAIKSYRYLDSCDWADEEVEVQTFLPVDSSYRKDYNAFYTQLGVDYYWSWLTKLALAAIGGLLLALGFAAIGDRDSSSGSNSLVSATNNVSVPIVTDSNSGAVAVPSQEVAPTDRQSGNLSTENTTTSARADSGPTSVATSNDQTRASTKRRKADCVTC